MSHPVAEQYRLMLGEVAFVEYQEKLGAVGFQPLDGMRNSSGEIPHIAHAGIGHKVNVENATWISGKVACRLALNGAVNRVQAYCRFEIASIAMITAINWIQRLTMRGLLDPSVRVTATRPFPATQHFLLLSLA